jgi:pantoate--beta-alanine ligase
MITLRTIPEIRDAVARARAGGKRVGLVPTMGYLHEGHLSLIDAARDGGAEFVVVSIFVNPMQFGPAEDFERYPRDEARDAALLAGRGVDAVFAPAGDAIYPGGFATRVVVGGPAAPLEGERRPGHFDGVATVVLKLFNIVSPDLAVFGTKDAQQCAVIERMVRDLDVPVRLLFAGTLREPDGVAMSSRNAYLSAAERAIAPALHRALLSGAELLEDDPDANPAAVEEAMLREVAPIEGIEVDYLRCVDAETFGEPMPASRAILLAGAVRVGSTRLIDNVRIRRIPLAAAEAAGEKKGLR